jgi:predicted nucleotidyltransferase
MKTVAIICEYNPFTYGHIRHLKAAREETGADTVVCIMSGSFTQRGDAAILDKYQRAELAARLGADMVAELPLIYSISPADNFAYGAMKIVSSLPGI